MWEGAGDRTETVIFWPPLLWPSTLCLSRSPDAQPEALGPLCWWWLSLLHLISNFSGPQTPSGFPRAPSVGRGFLYHTSSNSVPNSTATATVTLSWLSYIIVHANSIAYSNLEWHDWSSSRGNNCHAVHRTLSSRCISLWVYHGLYLVPFHQPNPPTRSLSITGHWNVSLPSGESLCSGMFARAEGQNTTTFVSPRLLSVFMSVSLSLSIYIYIYIYIFFLFHTGVHWFTASFFYGISTFVCYLMPNPFLYKWTVLF